MNLIAVTKIRFCLIYLCIYFLSRTDNPPHNLLDRGLISGNWEDFAKIDVWNYFPNRIMKSMFPGYKLSCWRGADCVDHRKSRRRFIDAVDGEVIVEKRIKYRYVEGLDMNAFVLFPIFECRRCKKTKAATDSKALISMGLPVVILRKAPIIPLECSIVTKELFEFIMTHMTSPCGADQIRRHISKMHTARYIEDGRVCMETQLLSRHAKNSTLHSYGFSQSHEIKPWPKPDLHCRGLGRFSTGVSRCQITRIFSASTSYLTTFADAIQGSLGGQVLKGDGNYSIARRLRMKLDGIEELAPTALQAC